MSMNAHELFINYLSVKLKSNDYGKEAKSIGDCGEDCSSCTHSIPDRIGNDQLYETPVKVSWQAKRAKDTIRGLSFEVGGLAMRGVANR